MCSAPSSSDQRPARRGATYEVEVLNGLAPICRGELATCLHGQAEVLDSKDPDRIAFEFSGKRSDLLALRTAVAVFEVLYFKVPHPGAIISGLEGERLFEAIRSINTRGSFDSFRIGAAGSDSEVFRRAKRLIERHSGLRNDEDAGEMSIRFRRSRLHRFGWDVLLRLTPMPLSARGWRVENMPGAVNATIAAAMVLLSQPKNEDRFLNLMCGSGTILAERAMMTGAKELVGLDISAEALAMAKRNLKAFPDVVLLQEDATKLSLATGSMDVICSDLPWGRLIGDRDSLAACYQQSLSEMTRVCSRGGRAIVLTQESGIFEGALEERQAEWTQRRSLRVTQSDYKPKIYVLERL